MTCVASADGFAESTVPQPGHAVDFIIDTVKANPGEVTLLVIGPVQGLFRSSWMGGMFESSPDATTSVYDTLALGYLVDPSFATVSEELFVNIDINFGPGYGRTLACWQEQATDQLQTLTVVKEFDNERFFEFHIDLITRPVPVVMQH